MEMDSIQTQVDRFYTLYYRQLANQLPRPGGFHIYSHGALINGVNSKRETDANGNVRWTVTISDGIDYGSYAMGYKADGTRRIPRGPRERYNFQTIDRCNKSVARIVALPSGGKVVIK